MRRANGEGTTFYDESRKRYVWRGLYVAPNGEKKRKSFQATDRKELSRRVAAWQRELQE